MQTHTADDYAGMLRALLPPGRVWRSIGSVLGKLLLGSADELARIDGRTGDLLNESNPSTATELLPEYERELEIVAAATTSERRANIVARLVRRQRFRPVDFQQALASLLALDASDVVVVERTRVYCIYVQDDREIYAFFIYRNPALSGTPFLASAQAMVDEMQPSHTLGTVVESISARYQDQHALYGRDIMGGFLCDDPESLTDHDPLGS